MLTRTKKIKRVKFKDNILIGYCPDCNELAAFDTRNFKCPLCHAKLVFKIQAIVAAIFIPFFIAFGVYVLYLLLNR
jgi:hypothetical protein